MPNDSLVQQAAGIRPHVADATRRRIDILLERLYLAQQDHWNQEERAAYSELREIVNANPVAADMAATTKDQRQWQPGF